MNTKHRITHLEHRQRERRRGFKEPGYYRREFEKKLQDSYEKSKGYPVVFEDMSLLEKQAFLQYEPERFTPEQRGKAFEQILDRRHAFITKSKPETPGGEIDDERREIFNEFISLARAGDAETIKAVIERFDTMTGMYEFLCYDWGTLGRPKQLPPGHNYYIY